VIHTRHRQRARQYAGVRPAGGPARGEQAADLVGYDVQDLSRGPSNLEIALVHDYLNQYGGAERVLEALHQMYPQAPVFTSIYARNLMPARFRNWDIRTSFMRKLPLATKWHQLYMPLYPTAFEKFDLSSYDVVLSSSSAFAKGVITEPDALHVCYCHSPMRFAWNYHDYMAGESVPRRAHIVLSLILNYVRLWDEVTAGRVDTFIANSRVVARRIRKRYGRSATVINPPVNTRQYTPAPRGEHGDYFLIVSRLIPYKRIDLVIDAFNTLELPLKVVGRGRQAAELQARAEPNVEFLGGVSEATLKGLYARCRCFIFPGEEDFGIAPLEAQASGRPVIAYGAGGALETVIPGITGEFFTEQTPDALADVVSRFNESAYDPVDIRHHAEKFDIEMFKHRIADFISTKLAEQKYRL
jgi:glycosyltransferase involved in cell wall biosynthesis